MRINVIFNHKYYHLGLFLPVSDAVGWSPAYWRYISDVGVDNVTNIGDDDVPALFDDNVLNDTWVADVLKTLDLELPESEKNGTLPFWEFDLNNQLRHLDNTTVLVVIFIFGLGKCLFYLPVIGSI